MDEALTGLNDAQREAVVHDRGPLMVLAGPGTGKTRVISHRIAHMVRERGVRPDTIVALTYTVKAANQLRERLGGLIGPEAEEVRAHTFHGLGLRILRRFADEADVSIGRLNDGRGGIIDSAQQTRLLRAIVMDRNLFKHERALGIDAVVANIGGYMASLSDAGVSPGEAMKFCEEAGKRVEQGMDGAGGPLDGAGVAAERERVRMLSEAARAIELFERACRDRGWLTFADLISLPIRILKGSGRAAAMLRDEWRHMVVDEFQDVNAAQIELLRLLMPAAGTPDLCVVGDDDQSIYEFRGADDLAFERFTKLWPGHATVRLSENYRSTGTIVKIANAVIGRAERRYAADKRISATRSVAVPGPVECVHLDDDAQDGEVIAAMILTDRAEREKAGKAPKWSDYAVVARTHNDADRVRTALGIEGIPTAATREGTPAEDEGVRDVLAWVELLALPHAVHAAGRGLARPPFSLDPRALHPLRARYRGELTRFEAGDTATANPGGFVDWLATGEPENETIARFVEMHAQLRRVAAERSAAETISRIIAAGDVAHADLLGPRERAERVKNLVGMLRFARERQGRLDAPGDVGAFWSYYQDLSADEQGMRDAALGSRVDGLSDGPPEEAEDAVRLITAHSAKGLEFDMVFVPRVTPRHGYGAVRDSDGPDMPAGVVHRGDERTAKQRAQAEARRLFYVACTRAERRLVLLSKKNKSRSKSTHYFEEIVHDSKTTDAVRVLEWKGVVQRAAALGVGQGFGWSRDADEFGAETRGFRVWEHRRAVFERARREVRVAAAGALDAAAGGDAEKARAAAERLGATAMRLGALAAAEATGAVPAWAADHDAGAYAQRVLDEAGRDPKECGEKDGMFAPGLRPPLRLSYTKIQDYLKCPRCFYAKYVLGLEAMPGPAQVVGIAVHGALEVFYAEQRAAEAEGHAPPTRQRLMAIGREAFFKSWPRHLEADKGQLDQVLAQLGVAYDRLRDPGSNVVEVEKGVKFPYGAHSFDAKIDRIDRYTGADGREAFRIVDYKTGRSTEKLREPKAGDLQMGVYALALAHLYGDGREGGEAELAGVAEYWILSTGERGVIELGAIDHGKVREQIDGVVEGLIAGRWGKGKDCDGECDVLGAE